MSVTIAPRPADFNHYWSTTMDELATLPAAPELTELPMRSTDFGTVYGLRLTSLHSYRIFAYYCVPHGDGPFPVLYTLPNYGSVVHVPAYEERQQYIVVALCHRGQRLSDQPFAAAYPGLLTTNIANADSYIYRGIVADCCRVIDFLQSRREVDQNKVALVGSDLALMTAALRPQPDLLYYTPGFFYGAEATAARSSAYPVEELNDFARTEPDQAAAMWQTLAYYEPVHFAGQVHCDTRLVTGDDPAQTQPLVDALAGAVDCYPSAHSGYRDGVAQAHWIGQRYGFMEPILPAAWQ
ncbi:MAG: acetylxylan esterase [Caldilineaceae bacterium]|nr:acetylxylan esterase [Caldilineaceae bacterium]